MKSWNKRSFFYLLCWGFLIVYTVFLFPSLPASQSDRSSPTTTELRGVWLTNVASGVLFIPWGINRAITQLSALNFNTIYPVVWNRGHTFYKSKLAKVVTGSDADALLNIMHGGQDVLEKIIEIARPHQLSVIPWFEYGFMTPSHSQLARRYPDWLTMGKEGEKSTNEVPLEEINDNSGHQQAWLNALHPEVQEFILGLIKEVVSIYHVDGIQLDDHFGMPVQFGYDAFTVDLYRQEHDGKSPPSDPFDPEWMAWRANKITNFMAKVHQSVKAIKPNAVISLSPNSQGFAYKYYLQDWETWVRRGFVDELILQVYRNNQKSFITELEQPAVKFARTRIPVSIGILTGTSTSPMKISQIQQQVKTVRDRNFPGISFFYWESLWGSITPEPPQQRLQVFQKLFAAKAVRP